jgi:ribonuclease III
LAFLGDSVLGLAVSSYLFPRFSNAGAGRLTKLRAQAVARGACADVARELRLPEKLRDAAGDGGRSADELVDSDRVLASVCEAVIGAVYLEYGYDATAPAVVQAFEGQVEEALQSPDDFKSLLQEKLARRGDVVEYVIVREEGPPHDRRFESVAQVEGEEIGRGAGKSKKSAEQSAALAALTAMDND